MKLYKRLLYPEIKTEFPTKLVVDILTSNERSSIRQGYYDEEMERQDARSFAFNYAWQRGDRSPVLRGFEYEGKLYEIDKDSKRIIIQDSSGYPFFDEDKLFGKNEYVFEGTLDEFIEEFRKAGYEVV